MKAAPRPPPEARGQPLPAVCGRPPPATGAAHCAELLGGRLVVRNTFLNYEEHEEPRQFLRTSRSAPALHPPSAGLGVPTGAPPSSPGAEWRTSVLFRNVPYLLTRDAFLGLLDSHGFRGQYDLVYLPMDFKTSQNLGYGFVNATSPEIAIRFFSVFEGFQAWPKKSLKTCSVCWSDRQGLESNVRVYRNSAVMKQTTPEAWKPALFSQGSRVPFPAPTRRGKQHQKQHRSTGGAAARRSSRQPRGSDGLRRRDDA